MSLRDSFGDFDKPMHRPAGSFDRLILGPTPEKIRLIKGDYKTVIQYSGEKGPMIKSVPFYAFSRHWIPNKNRYAICGKKHEFDEDSVCIGCDHGYRTSQGFVHTVIHLAYYHKVEYTNKDGKVVMRDGKPLLIDRQCEGSHCKMCRTNKERFFGKKLHWTTSYRGMNHLMATEDIISSSCHCGNELLITGHICPICGTSIPKNGEFFCSKCVRIVKSKPVYSCNNCGEPRPVSIYDIDILVQKVGSGADTTIAVYPKSAPSKVPEGYKGDMEPLDLPSIFRPPTFREQREIYEYYGDMRIDEISEDETASDPDWMKD